MSGAEQLWRESERLADRLLVVGPRMEQRGSAEAEAVLAGVRAALQRLADLAADADGRDRRSVPDLGGRALADQLLVLAHDLRPFDEPTVAVAGEVLAQVRALI